jgi:hypothetical protein
MKNLVKELDEFRKIYAIKENLNMNGINDIPGLHLVTAEINATKAEIVTSEGKIYVFDLDQLDIVDEDLLNPRVDYDILKLYHSILTSRYVTETSKKLEVLKEAEGLELFDDIIESGGFLGNISHDLSKARMTTEDLDVIINNSSSIYSSGFGNEISLDGQNIIREYLDTWLEIAGAKLYMFIESLGLGGALLQLTPGLQYDNVKKEILTESVKYSNSPNSKINVASINKIVNKAAQKAGLTILKPYDFETGRNVTAVTETIAFNVDNDDLVITAKTNEKTVKFNIYGIDGPIDEIYQNLFNEEELAKALIDLQ